MIISLAAEHTSSEVTAGMSGWTGFSEWEEEEFLLHHGPKKVRKAIEERRKTREQAQRHQSDSYDVIGCFAKMLSHQQDSRIRLRHNRTGSAGPGWIPRHHRSPERDRARNEPRPPNRKTGRTTPPTLTQHISAVLCPRVELDVTRPASYHCSGRLHGRLQTWHSR